MAASPAPDLNWEAVRHAYEGSDQTVAQILQRFGLTQGRLYRRAQKEGWQGRREADAVAQELSHLSVSRSHPTASADLHGDAHHKKAALAARLFHALEDRIMSIEDDLHDHDASHGERDAKALTAMAKALDMLGEMMAESEAQAVADGGDKKQEIDVDEFRQSLIDRLERMRSSGDGA